LSATSHRTSEIEVYQAQSATGPCVDTVRTGRPVEAVGASEIEARWGEVGRRIVEAGFHAVHAFPMHWREHVIGGLNVFSVAEEALVAPSRVLAQSFADLATLAIVQPLVTDDEDL